MFIRALLAAAVLAVPPAFAAEFTLDTSRSLAELEVELSARPAPPAVETLALGAVTFLRGVETTLQDRYEVNAAFRGSLVDIPVLRLPVPENVEPAPLEPDLFVEIFRGVDADMDRTRAILSAARLGPDDKLVVDIAGLWFDIDGDGDRGADEGLLEVVDVVFDTAATAPETGQPQDSLIVHFDVADAEWLMAYTHLLSGVSEFVLAFDPTEVIADVLAAQAAMVEVRGTVPATRYSLFADEEALVDAIAVIYGALNRTPDAERFASAHSHMLAMIDHNRAFWTLVDRETDNDLEWIPNAAQEAALGFELPDDTGAVWQDVLADAEAVLKGELLVPHWRTEPGGGINVAALVADPPAFDLVTWIHGSGLVPYMEKGPLVDAGSLGRFSQLFRGDAMLFAVLLN